MTATKLACSALLVIDVFALPLLLIAASFSPIAGMVGGLLVMLIHPLLLWRL